MPESGSILIAGNWHWDIYEEALASGFRHLGWRVTPFTTDEHLPRSRWAALLLRARLAAAAAAMNEALLAADREARPTALLLHRPELIVPDTVRRLKEADPGRPVLLYHNDNPYAGLLNRLRMRHFRRCVPMADAVLVYRPSDLEEARRLGARRAELLPPYYLSWRHRPTPGGTPADVVFIGHYEPDGRAGVLDLLRRDGVDVRVQGTGWEKAAAAFPWIARQGPRRVWGEEYSALISSARMALVFFSEANRDVYTRRCLEIPACGTMMLAPRTRELEAWFRDGEEAVFYDGPEDLLAKVRRYLGDGEARRAIAAAGRERCLRDGHDERGRAAMLARLIRELAGGGER